MQSSEPPAPTGPGFHLRLNTEGDQPGSIDRLTERFGRRVGLSRVLDDLNRSLAPAKLRGRAVAGGFGWDKADQSSPRWSPRGITAAPGRVTEKGPGTEGRQLLAVAWHSRQVGGEDHGSRLTFCDLGSGRYRHVLLVTADESFGEVVYRPLAVTAGGLAWTGRWLHVAGERRGLFSCDLDDVVEVAGDGGESGRPGTRATFGYRYLLPVRTVLDAVTDPSRRKMHYSFLSRHAGSGDLVAGEAAGDLPEGSTRRLVQYRLTDEGAVELDESGRAFPVVPEAFQLPEHVRGTVAVGDTWYATVAAGRRPGQLLVGAPDSFRTIKRALPAGPADLTHTVSPDGDDRLWTVTDEPGRRYLVGIDPAALADNAG